MTTIFSNVALECYLDGGEIAVYSIRWSGNYPTQEEVKQFASNDGAIGEFKKASVSISHSIDHHRKFLILVKQ